MLSNTQIFDQVSKFHSSLRGVDHCLSRIWKHYQSKNFMYLVDPRDREVLYPVSKKRCTWLERSELHGGKTDRRPEEPDLRTFAVEACHDALRRVANTNVKREKPFNFMGLPGEIRNMIYGYLLQGAEISISVRTFRKYVEPRPSRFSKSVHIVPRPGCFGGSVYDLYYAEFGNTVHKDQPKGISVAILRVNSHIHKEAEMILYKSHTFDFGVCAPAALAFFQTLPQAALRFIPRIRIDYCCAKGRHESAFRKTYNALATLAPNIKLFTKVTFHFGDTDRDLTTWPVSRALARMQGIKSLRSEKGQKFVSDFADIIREVSWVQGDHRGAIKEVEYTVG